MINYRVLDFAVDRRSDVDFPCWITIAIAIDYQLSTLNYLPHIISKQIRIDFTQI
ncbi:MAG: hypothetical protein ACRC62_14795 [Microcoleus sp.]